MEIKQAEFLTSVGNLSQLPESLVAEIAIVGKSNVGKSTFINMLANNRKLARTSKDPGRTRLINYFGINKDQFMLVDLPGYGFAKVSQSEKMKWAELIEGYLVTSKALKNVFVLVDSRHAPTEDDIQMFKYLYYYNKQFSIFATKCDKLSKSEIHIRRQALASAIGVGVDNIIMVSSETKLGRDKVLERIEYILAAEENDNDDDLLELTKDEEEVV